MKAEQVRGWLEFLRNVLCGAGKRKTGKQSPDVNGIAEPPNRERRFDLEKRRRVAEMSPEEMMQELLTSEVTGLPNRRAFDEAGAAPAVAMSDVDGLKALNDQYEYAAGDALLKAKAEALREAGLEAYHDKGDEFIYRGNSIDELRANLALAGEILRARTIVFRGSDGSTFSFSGAEFSYGVAEDIHGAESQLQRHKDDRRARGELGRGQCCGITSKMADDPAQITGVKRAL